VSALALLIVTGLGVGGLYFLMASGLSLIFGLMRILSFAHGALLTVCGFCAWEIMEAISSGGTTIGFLVGLVCSAAIGGMLAVTMELIILRPLFGRELEQLLATIGVGFAAVALLQGIYGPNDNLVNLPDWVGSVTNIGGARIPDNRFLLIGSAVLVWYGITAFLKATRHGQIIRAGVQNREMVEALGINVKRSFTLVFGLAGVAAGIAGALAVTYYQTINPETGDQVLIYAFIALIIGGLGSVTGAAMAAALMGVVQSVLNYYLGSGAGDAAVIVLLVLTLVVRPQGLLGTREITV